MMTLVTTLDACEPPLAGQRPPTPRRVLFVAPEPPAAALAAALAQAQFEGLWSNRLDSSRLALDEFAAVVIDGAAADGTPPARRVAQWRRQLPCALLVLAEHEDTLDEIVALELGADAYLVKPVSARRLCAHLAALQRTRNVAPTAPVRALLLPLAGWALDVDGGELQRAGRRILLSPLLAALLAGLAKAAGRPVARTQLAASLPGGAQLTPRAVDVYVHRLRQRLCEAGADELRIDAVRSRGYRLVAAGRDDGGD